MRVLALVVLSFTAVAAVPSNPQRIVGGSTVTVNQYPTITALLYSYYGAGSSFSQACGGTILTSKAVLTAAHCTEGDSVTQWRIRVGSTFANSGGVVYSLSSITTHPDHNPRTADNDVAILRTNSFILFNEVVQPAAIAGQSYNLADNAVVWAAGWGTTQSGGRPSEQLRHVQLWSVNHQICQTRYANFGRVVTDNMLCSGWLDVGGRDQCQGDSGGPLYHNGVLVGVCSWGYGCANARYPGVNTRVSRFATWIQANA